MLLVPLTIIEQDKRDSYNIERNVKEFIIGKLETEG